jgi:hypothetical protein
MIYTVYGKYFSTLGKAKEFVMLLDSTGVIDTRIDISEIELDNPKSVKKNIDSYVCQTQTWTSTQQ